MASGRLVLVATPIGNLGDLSPRGAEALTQADRWFVEDSRVSGKLQSHLGIKRPMRVLNEHTTPTQLQRLIDEAATGGTTAVLSDGGTPCISDPGAHLVDLAVQADLEIDAIPGPSAVTTALMLSGFYAQRFAFLGFLPRKAGPAQGELAVFSESTMTLVLFESPHRVLATLHSAAKALGDRRYVACREMTKLHQEVRRGTLANLPSELPFAAKGEYCLVIEGRRRKKSADNEDVC